MAICKRCLKLHKCCNKNVVRGKFNRILFPPPPPPASYPNSCSRCGCSEACAINCIDIDHDDISSTHYALLWHHFSGFRLRSFDLSKDNTHEAGERPNLGPISCKYRPRNLHLSRKYTVNIVVNMNNTQGIQQIEYRDISTLTWDGSSCNPVYGIAICDATCTSLAFEPANFAKK